MFRLHRRSVVAVLLLAGMTSVASATERLPASKIELMLSRGAMANVVNLDAGLAGVPVNRQEVSGDEIFPIEANTAVLAFPDSHFSFGGLQRLIVLTEDGLWGVAPLMSSNGSPSFLGENEIKRIVQDFQNHQITWVIVTSNFSAANAAIGFSRGEIFPIDTVSFGTTTAVFDPGDALTASKSKDIAAVVGRGGRLPDGVLRTPKGGYAIKLSGEQKDHVEFVDASKLIDYVQELNERDNQRSRWWSSGGSETDPMLSRWTKSIWLNSPFRVECSDKVTEKNHKLSEYSGELKVKFGVPAFLNALTNIGVSVDAGVSATKTWTNESDITSTIKDTSFDVDSYLVSSGIVPTIISFGNASSCPGDPPAANFVQKKFFIATIPGIAGAAIDLTNMTAMQTLDQSITMITSGHLQTKCLAHGYEKILGYLVGELSIERPIARLIAAHIVKVQPDGFLDC